MARRTHIPILGVDGTEENRPRPRASSGFTPRQGPARRAYPHFVRPRIPRPENRASAGRLPGGRAAGLLSRSATWSLPLQRAHERGLAQDVSKVTQSRSRRQRPAGRRAAIRCGVFTTPVEEAAARCPRRRRRRTGPGHRRSPPAAGRGAGSRTPPNPREQEDRGQLAKRRPPAHARGHRDLFAEDGTGSTAGDLDVVEARAIRKSPRGQRGEPDDGSSASRGGAGERERVNEQNEEREATRTRGGHVHRTHDGAVLGRTRCAHQA